MRNLIKCTCLAAMLYATAVAAGADPLPNATCLPKRTWACAEQGTLSCNYQQSTCSGECKTCLGNDTVPAKMCFRSEGGECPPAASYICGQRFDNGVCTDVEGNCICVNNLVTGEDGTCTFWSCNN
ncbi:hypothetical protein PLANPX_5182 [Lacipirellula parvula]|uniref:Uncharacterized protein n=1 Tax=Lacipirellula parvula TaxID=2650471 RepID=A0A5K7XFI4_9BACT|nr:hypothetical protein PLANPX_5182 [Lacipirellula parvula]